MRRLGFWFVGVMLAFVILLAAFELGFRQGQLKASIGIVYYWYDRGGNEWHSVEPRRIR